MLPVDAATYDKAVFEYGFLKVSWQGRGTPSYRSVGSENEGFVSVGSQAFGNTAALVLAKSRSYGV